MSLQDDDRLPRRTCSRRRPSTAGSSSSKSPILDQRRSSRKIKELDSRDKLRAVTLPMLFRVDDGGAGLEKALDGPLLARPRPRSPTAPRCSSSPTAASTSENAPIPSLLATSGRAPSPDPRRHAHALRPGRRDGRAARGACTSPADRLRRRRRQPVSGVRDASADLVARRACSKGVDARTRRSRTTSRPSTRACSRS